MNTVEAAYRVHQGGPRRGPALPPDEHHLAVEGHTQSLRPERATARCSSGAPPEPDQTIDLKARPHLTIGSRNRSGLLRRKTTLPGHRTERERHGGIGGWRESVSVTDPSAGVGEARSGLWLGADLELRPARAQLARQDDQGQDTMR